MGFQGLIDRNVKAQKEVSNEHGCKESKRACHCFEEVSFNQLHETLAVETNVSELRPTCFMPWKVCFPLDRKKLKYLEPKKCGIVIADSIHIKVLKVSDSSSSQLSSLIDELSAKGNYKYLFVGDFTPPKRIVITSAN